MPVPGGARLEAAAPQFARRDVAMRGLLGVSGAVAQDHRISDRVRAADRTSEFWSMERRTGLVRAIWCLTHNLQPAKVVETGVARGLKSRFILEAMECNGTGHLWSIDLPPTNPELQRQVGAAVEDRLRDRWSYIRGSSRRHLPGLLHELGQIDLFLHDSLHSERKQYSQ